MKLSCTFFLDDWTAPRDFDPARESTRATTLAQGLKNGEHTLTLIPKGESKELPILAFCVFQPPSNQ